jgi:plastocyanin
VPRTGCENVTENSRATPAYLWAGARAIGSGLVLASGAIHLDLYLTGYRHIKTVGPSFLVQSAAAILIGAALLLTLSVMNGLYGRLVAASGALLLAGTLAGYLVSLRYGLFGFHEVQTTAGLAAGAVEIVGMFLLGMLALNGERSKLWKAGRYFVAPVSAVAVLLLVLAELSASGAGTSAASPAPPVRSTKASITVIIKNFAFHPANPRVSPGERIVVRNEDPVDHTFTSSTTGLFNTGLILPGTSRSVSAPSRPGSYGFLCLIHQYMTGTLIVTAGT